MKHIPAGKNEPDGYVRCFPSGAVHPAGVCPDEPSQEPHNEMQCARCPYVIGPHRYESEDGWLCQECEEFDKELEDAKKGEIGFDYYSGWGNDHE